MTRGLSRLSPDSPGRPLERLSPPLVGGRVGESRERGVPSPARESRLPTIAQWVERALESADSSLKLHRQMRHHWRGPGPARGERRVQREVVGSLRRALSLALLSDDYTLRVRVRERLRALGRRGDGTLLAARDEDLQGGGMARSPLVTAKEWDPRTAERQVAGEP